MDNHTFRSRVSRLLQKSRKALRLYSSVATLPADGGSQFAEAQVREWKRVNSDLVQSLTVAIDCQHTKRAATDICALRDRFHLEWRKAEAEMRNRQMELILSAEQGDFVKTALLSQELVGLKARTQACEAAYHELGDVVRHSRVAEPMIELSSDSIVFRDIAGASADAQPTNVIPLRLRK